MVRPSRQNVYISSNLCHSAHHRWSLLLCKHKRYIHCCIIHRWRSVGDMQICHPLKPQSMDIIHLLHSLLCDMQFCCPRACNVTQGEAKGDMHARGQQNSCHTENHATNVLLFIGKNLHARRENKK